MKEEIITFILGVVASIITTVILSRIRLFKTYLNKLFGVDASVVYKNQKEAVADIQECFRRSSNIKILTLRGKSFLDGSLSFIVDDLKNSQILYFLFADTDITSEFNHIKDRAEELSKYR